MSSTEHNTDLQKRPGQLANLPKFVLSRIFLPSLLCFFSVDLSKRYSRKPGWSFIIVWPQGWNANAWNTSRMATLSSGNDWSATDIRCWKVLVPKWTYQYSVSLRSFAVWSGTYKRKKKKKVQGSDQNTLSKKKPYTFLLQPITLFLLLSTDFWRPIKISNHDCSSWLKTRNCVYETLCPQLFGWYSFFRQQSSKFEIPSYTTHHPVIADKIWRS